MIERRRFLQTLGLAGLATGLPTLGLRSALAAESGAPKRLLLLSHCHGWPYEAWKMRPPGLGEETAWELELADTTVDTWSAPLAPLYEHRARMIALDGLSLGTAELDMDGNRHDTGWVHAWTGNWADFSGTDTRAWSPSLDQMVAAQIARPDRLPSLELSLDAGLESGRPISYALNGGRLPAENDPLRVWQRLFAPSVNGDPLALRQRSLLDFAHGEYAALAPRLGAVQRHKLDAHYALLSGLGERLEGMANLSCGSIPALGESLATYDARFDAFSELIGAAFSCDITRVVSLSMGEMPTADFGWDHLTDDVHKGLAHEIYNNADKHQAMTDYIARHAGQVARLVSLLSSLPDVDGQSVMDNTLIVWGSELADGWHGYWHYCPVIIGGGWHFRTGRYLYQPHETPIEVLVPAGVSAEGYVPLSGKPHQHLLVSAAQAMGLTVEQVGIDHVQSQSGHKVDCTGGLSALI
jgi:hypothetical protein